MLQSVLLLWQDLLYYARRGLYYLVFFLPGYVRFYLGQGKVFEVKHLPICLTHADDKITDALMQDIYNFHGEEFEWADDKKEDLWQPIATSHIFSEAMHRFIWLPHLADKDDKTRRKMLQLIGHWARNHSHWSQPAWRSDIVAERLYHLLSFYRQITQNMNEQSVSRFHTQLHQHYQHLKTTADWEMRGSKKLIAQIILLICMICKEENNNVVNRYLRLLVDELNHQIFPDGGHCERNPETHFIILRWLCVLYELFLRDQRTMPEEISGTIDRMIPFLRMMQRQDGRLFIFNGAAAISAEEIEETLKFAVRGSRMPGALKSASYSGFETISNDFVQVMMDVGDFPCNNHARMMHAESLAIEVMMGGQPIIVNCGSLHYNADPYWASAQRGTMAHSTIILDNYNSSSLRLYSLRRAICKSVRKEEGEHLLLQGGHQGYMRPCRTMVERSLYLANKERRLVGEDKLLADEGHMFHIRFHLHAAVIVELQDNKVYLRVANKFVCQFLYEGADLRVEDSIYSPNHDTLYHNKQLVLYGKNYSQNTVVRWSIKYIGVLEDDDAENSDIEAD